MESLLPRIADLLLEMGPWIVFAVTLTETAIFLGLLIPAEATVLLAAFLAAEGLFDIRWILAATLGGALAGDSLGYVLGRFAGTRVVATGGVIGRMWARHEPRARALFGRRPVYGVSVARLVSFVRTLTPWMAGMSAMPYRRYLPYDAAGVALWGGASVALGYLAGESWHLLTGVVGTVGALILVTVAAASWIAARRARRVDTAEGEGEPGGVVSSGDPAVGRLGKDPERGV